MDLRKHPERISAGGGFGPVSMIIKHKYLKNRGKFWANGINGVFVTRQIF